MKTRLALVALSALAGCAGKIADDATAGCIAGNRSQCVEQAELGDRFACARLHDHSVWCWGSNAESQLGYMTTDLCPMVLPNGQTQSVSCHTYPFQVPGLNSVTNLAAGRQFACAVRADGGVWCWGSNSAGQLGNAGAPSSVTPTQVAGLGGVQAIALGARHACALQDGAVLCWGADDRLQLGVQNPSQICISPDGSTPCETSPKQVMGLGHATAIAAGDAHTCAVMDDGSVACWGANDWGQLGGGAAGDPSSKPVAVKSGHVNPFASAVVAGIAHTCTLRDDGAVFCWGRADHGELGVPPPSPTPDRCPGPCSPSPLQVVTLPNQPKLPPEAPTADGGAPPDMAMEPPDMAMPMELPDSGEAGDFAIAPDLAPVPVMGPPTPPTALSAGGSHTCVVVSDGTLRCWGSDDEDELGDGQRGPSMPPSAVIAQPGAAHDNPLGGAKAVSAGVASTCALLADGSLRCWGSNLVGALGEGDLAMPLGPVPVAW